ncbi:hypothetical protein BBJ28_00014727 [Nothophytophthora sp. Chile5]|nr:hypothetical protein BBJ28_00014727 [Nothophytophthora sp. Chile5]
MAFLPEEGDAMRAFEAALSFVDDYVLDAKTSDGTLTTTIPAEGAAATDRRQRGQLELPADSGGGALSVFSDGDGGAMPVLQRTDANQSAQTGVGDCTTAASLSTSSMTTKQRRAATNAKRKLLRKAGVYGNPNRARNERKLEISYLRDKLGQLELGLRRLQQQPNSRVLQVASTSELAQGGQEEAVHAAGNIVADSTALLCVGSQSSGVWRGVAGRQRLRREKAERENIRLKLVLEGQIKVAKSLKLLLEKRTRQHMAECSLSENPNILQGRTLDYRADVADFQDLLGHLDAAYREVDAVFAANGLATMELSQQDIHMREGINGMYLEVFANKVIPFDLRSTAEATWQHFKGVEKHRGNLYEKAAKQNLETPYTIIEDFAKELFAGSARTDVRVKQIVRRYVEADREIVIWVATVAPAEITHKPFAGLTFRHRGYALMKRAAASTPQQELSLLQLCTLVSLDNDEGAIYDQKYVRTLTDFVLSNAAENIQADQELIENVLMDETLHGVTNGLRKLLAAMAFLAGDDDGMQVFEAALSFVDEYAFNGQLPVSAETPALRSENVQSGSITGLAPLLRDSRPPPSSAVGGALPVGRDTALVDRDDERAALSLAPSQKKEEPLLSALGDAKLRGRARTNAKKRLLRKAGLYDDPNRARKERKLEMSFLRQKLAQLQLQLQTLQSQKAQRFAGRAQDAAQGQAIVARRSSGSSAAPSQISAAWQRVADCQLQQREKSERENVRLKLIMERQHKMAEALEALVQMRIKQQVTVVILFERHHSVPGYAAVRTLDFRADIADFQELLGQLDAAHREVDAVFAANRLDITEASHNDVQLRTDKGIKGVHLEVFANKAMPFEPRATAEAAWDHFKGMKKHHGNGNLYEKAAKNLETPYTIIEDYAKELFANTARADVRVKQIVRRYVEADRELIILVASATPISIAHKPLAGLTFRYRCYALVKRAEASTRQNELSLLQLCTLASLDDDAGMTYDPAYVRALTNFLLGNTAGNIKADQELIENVLVEQVLQQRAP